MFLLLSPGCFRTATELAKLLLHVSPTKDVMRVLCTIDYYLLRSRQLALLEQLCGCPGLHIPPLALPNLTYSHALSGFLRELAGLTPGAGSASTPTAVAADGVGGSASAGAGDGGGGGSSSLRLVRAILLYPGCVLPLLTKCGIKAGDTGVAPGCQSLSGLPARHCEWATVFAHPLFASGVGDAAVRHVESLIVAPPVHVVAAG